MEIVPEGTNFRLVSEDELPAVADILVQYMPESLKFHQTIKTYLNNKVWDFHFYVAKNWPEDPICLHFPGCTSTNSPNVDNIYESVTIFCPSERAELVDLVTSEDKLIDLTQPLYLNFTHEAIVNRLEKHYEGQDKITGDVYACDNPPEDATTDGQGSTLVLITYIHPIHIPSPWKKYSLRLIYHPSYAATGRGVSSLTARTHEGGARPLPSERHRVPRSFREAGRRAACIRHLRRRAARRLDGAVLLWRHVLDANSTRVPAQGVRDLPRPTAHQGGRCPRLCALRSHSSRERRVALSLHQTRLPKTVPNGARRLSSPLKLKLITSRFYFFKIFE